ncbi:MAG: malate synthase G [Candidatus Latescibacterota bacterium]|nr:malate synthase G [Candidatus Latescibacterota bacterium]
MSERIRVGNLKIDPKLHELVREELVPETGVDTEEIWFGLEKIIEELGGLNKRILERRDELQVKLDEYYRNHRGKDFDQEHHKIFLSEIGYLQDELEDVKITTENVDSEIAEIAGPQLVVPVDNARYCLNAANARWGSLYDALYGTDVIDEDGGCERSSNYNPRRGALVVARANLFLDEAVPIRGSSYAKVLEWDIVEDKGQQTLKIITENGVKELSRPEQFVGFKRGGGNLDCILFKNNGLHIELHIDSEDPIGRGHRAGLKDVVVEAAITTIQDCEDSVSAVDAEDKVRVYRNWCGLMKGTLSTSFDKNGKTVNRSLEKDRSFIGIDGEHISLPGRSLLLVRNVGLHMYTDTVLYNDQPVPEGFLDALMTSLAALHDIRGKEVGFNSRTGSIYIVKPKMHGPEEVAATVELFTRVEEVLKLPVNTLKIGIMDEERRTSVNLQRSMSEASSRLIFINTGFLDRTGDEIHSSFEAGPMLPKSEIKNQVWLQAYEDQNVDVGIEMGLIGRGQIGKGMWAMPDAMSDMLDAKMGHPQSGATTAWVPSPTAAVLHAIHYHQISVFERQNELRGRKRANLSSILTPPLLRNHLTSDEIQQELDNNVQGILGYVSRWIGQGVGCSKVPDINGIGLMEDRATLRISSQHISNWLHHGLIERAQVLSTFKRMALVVDGQNANDPNYCPLTAEITPPGFSAALDLVFLGRDEPNGYTERILHSRRREAKLR